ncbi:MAG: hypothetical protein HOH29_07360 [Cellvibrionales bacterium]|nr:hypothetical protein [Cellvibrionales bacterium]MBT5923536.1 hypothetical protein [Cellvibrionales bacterium]
MLGSVVALLWLAAHEQSLLLVMRQWSLSIHLTACIDGAPAKTVPLLLGDNPKRGWI